MPKTRIGIVTGGGDCPGLNAVIRVVVKKLIGNGIEVLGIRDGFEGLVEDRIHPVTFDDVSGIINRGGTILGTTNKADPFRYGERGDVSNLAMKVYKRHKLDGFVAIGGDGTMHICGSLVKKGMKIVGVPKTIDNDVVSTDETFGFDTAVSVVAHAVDALHSTADAHRRVMVVEVMGRNAGWIALYGGVAGGGDVILIPELPFDIGAIARAIRDRHRTRRFTIVVVAEGAKPEGGEVVVSRIVKDSVEPIRLGGIGGVVAKELERLTGYESRVTVLGHLQRAGSPTAYDRILSTRFGSAAETRARTGKWGRMVALQGGRVVDVPIASVAGKVKTVPVDHELILAARAMGTHFGREIGR